MTAATSRAALLTVSLAQARRIAIAAQGLATPRPARVGAAALHRLVDRLGLLQIDSVNVLARAHLLPVYARLGSYDPALLDRMTQRPPRRLVETWAHEASFVPPEVYHDLHWWRQTQREHRWVRGVLGDSAPLVEAVRDLVRERGPLTSRQVQQELGDQASGGGWWKWAASKDALEALFRIGELASAGRTPQFERRYDLTERVIPPLPAGQVPRERDQAIRELVRRSARALGIGTVRCLRDYYRLDAASVRVAVADLVELGDLVPVLVPGWGRVFLDTTARRPRTVAARALLAPFDPLVFERARLLALFGMHYRIGIYTPAAQRTHGYYVLPFLLGEELVARVDLKADRAGGVLLVRQAHPEPIPANRTAREAARWPTTEVVAHELTAELASMASWLGLTEIRLDPDARGDLIAPLARSLAR